MSPEEICRRLVEVKQDLDRQAEAIDAGSEDEKDAQGLLLTAEAAIRYSLIAEAAEELLKPRPVAVSIDCCGRMLDADTHLDGDAVAPRPGDIGVCAYCSAVLVFTDDGGRRLASDAEIAALPTDTRAQLSRAMWVVDHVLEPEVRS